jgi:voltage-gated potassium channel Kch
MKHPNLAHHKHLEIRLGTALVLLIIIIFGAAFYYHNAEGWTLIDSIYFAVSTATTVGYGDFVPTTQTSKIVTIAFMVLSTGLALYSIALIAQRGILLHIHRHKKEE